ncbi:uncharacterized protein [Typha latifolia]|uniref:uncharacterized protein n=1 Tax=Typha latifolia TaxID=4733 RepID=UPI003C2E31AB
MVAELEDNDYKKFLDNRNIYDNSSIDPVYKIFLEHLREDGKSYILEMMNGDNGRPVFVKYEGEDLSSRENNSETLVKSGNILFDRGSYCLADSLAGERSYPSSHENVCFPSIPNKLSGERCSVLSKQLRMRCSLVEESYLAFLSLLKLKNGSMILEYESGISVIYEEQKETNTSENLTTENVIYPDEQGLVPYSQSSDLIACEDVQETMLPLSYCGSAEFENKLMAILSEPYDQNEYEALMEEATDRKPLNKDIHLRSGSKSYMTKEVGLSYLDRYPDLARQINSSDCYGRLSLLRKFFFWLKNLCHEGAFMPWLSKPLSCDPIAADECEIVVPLKMARG